MFGIALHLKFQLDAPSTGLLADLGDPHRRDRAKLESVQRYRRLRDDPPPEITLYWLRSWGEYTII